MNKRDNLRHMKRMESALLYMLNNMQKKLSLEEVAAAEGVKYNPAYFGDIFREYFDMPWKSYYIKLKMRAAARFIQYERISLNIAKIFGYSDIRNFSKTFLKEIGVTPAQFLESGCPVPDMPARKQLCGVPIQMELMKRDEVSICGVPLYHPPGGKAFNRLEDAAYALTCVPDWRPKLNGTPYVGIWSFDEKGEQCYLIGSVTDASDTDRMDMIRQDIGGGQYAVFSADRAEDDEKNTEISRMMARYAMKEWRHVNFKETNRLGYTYEVFDDKKLYLYLPLLGDYGDNEHWRTSMQASLYREYIDSHITEHIRASQFASKAHYTERWLRDSFKSLYGITPQKYADLKRLKLAAGELAQGQSDKSEILKKYHFTSMAVFARKFINHFGVPYRDFRESETLLPKKIPVHYDPSRQIKASVINLPRIRAALHPLTTTPEYMDVGDYPGLVTYWFTHDWRHDNKGYDPKSTGNIGKIFIYDLHLFKRKKVSELDYSIGLILEVEEKGEKGEPARPAAPEGFRERILAGGRYVQFEMEDAYEQKELLEIYQQMESSIFLKWYYDNQLIISTTKEKLICYKDGKMYFYIPLEI